MLSKFREYVDTHIWHLTVLFILLVITSQLYQIEMERRATMGYVPRGGGELLIIPLVVIIYYSIKSIKEAIRNFQENDWYV